jgi:hypothetical protein
MRAGEFVAGRYRLDSMVRVGGMGVVWRAVDDDTGVPAAVKLLAGGGGAAEAAGGSAATGSSNDARRSGRYAYHSAVCGCRFYLDHDAMKMRGIDRMEKQVRESISPSSRR